MNITHESFVISCSENDESSFQIADNADRYQWSQELQGAILSSYHWGNLVSQIPGGMLVQKFGGKITFLVSASLSAVVVALIPLSVTYG